MTKVEDQYNALPEHLKAMLDPVFDANWQKIRGKVPIDSPEELIAITLALVNDDIPPLNGREFESLEEFAQYLRKSRKQRR